MARLAKFLKLTPPRRILLLRAGLTLTLVKLALLMLPFATARRLVGKFTRRRRFPSEASLAPGHLVWSVEAVSRVMPCMYNCLVRALAAELMLARAGYPCQLKFGAARSAGGQFMAHAWLEAEGGVVIGEYELGRYTPLLVPEPDPELSHPLDQ
jgi:hypothetical protein